MDEALEKIEEIYKVLNLPKIKDFVIEGNFKLFVGVSLFSLYIYYFLFISFVFLIIFS